MPTSFEKDPQATLDYLFDWSEWLGSGESITSATVTAESGLTVDSTDVVNGTGVRAWLSGGEDWTAYEVTCSITTDSSPARVDERTMTIMVRDR
jgi:hypothetical protein